MKVTKRNGKLEDLSIEKIHKVLGWAIDGIKDVSLSDIEMNSQLNFTNKMSTREIHSVLIKSANNLISEETPNYQYVAARLAMYALRKDVWGGSEPPRLFDHIHECVRKHKVYDQEILKKYSTSEIHKLGKYINHDRDDNFTYAGIQQTIDKYLLKNRNTNQIYETPQFAYMLIAMCVFIHYPDETRIEYVKKLYDAISKFKINLPTPIMSGVRTVIKQYASCILIDVADSLHSIFASMSAAGLYTAKRAGIGLNTGRIRPVNSPIRGGEVIHTGLIPYLKVFQDIIKSTSQNGIRGGNCTCHTPFWHTEILDVIPLKNNAGTDDNRVRGMDYSIQMHKIFYERLIADDYITLFSPDELKKNGVDLYSYFPTTEFEQKYIECEANDKLQFKKRIKAKEFIELLVRERLETGRIYIMNIDHCNTHSSYKEPVFMSNLCKEVTVPTKPISSLEDSDGEIGVCILAAINLLEAKKEEFPELCDIIVRMEDEIIEYQEYAVPAAEKFCKNKRSIGIGFTNLAGLFAKSKVSFDSIEALHIADEYAELLQYYLLDASANLAKEKGPCLDYHTSKYSDGILSIDTAKVDALELIDRKPSLDWNSLREKIKQFGLRNTTLTCNMPAESSSVIQNSTNGCEPVRDLIIYKKSKMGVLKQAVPNISTHGKYYTKAFSLKSNKAYTDITAILQKWFDMSISMNHYYNYQHYEGGNIPLSLLVKDILYAYKMGIKTMYYCNTPDGDAEVSCESGACSI